MKIVFLFFCLFVTVRYLQRSRRLIAYGILDFNSIALIKFVVGNTEREYTASYSSSHFQKKGILGRFEIYIVSNGLDFQIKRPLNHRRDLKEFEAFLDSQDIF